MTLALLCGGLHQYAARQDCAVAYWQPLVLTGRESGSSHFHQDSDGLPRLMWTHFLTESLGPSSELHSSVTETSSDFKWQVRKE